MLLRNPLLCLSHQFLLNQCCVPSMVVPAFIVFSFYYKGKCIKTLPTMHTVAIKDKKVSILGINSMGLVWPRAFGSSGAVFSIEESSGPQNPLVSILNSNWTLKICGCKR